MPADDRTHKLLEEIRDIQHEHLAEYKRVTQQSLDLQQRAVERQHELGAIYKRMALVGVVLTFFLLGLLLYLLVRWSGYLFR